MFLLVASIVEGPGGASGVVSLPGCAKEAFWMSTHETMFRMHHLARFAHRLRAAALIAPSAAFVQAAPANDADLAHCQTGASTACYFAFDPAGAGRTLHYYASLVPGAQDASPAPAGALIALHGHSRDANKTFDAALLAARRAGHAGDTLIVAPVFQVDAERAAKCRTAGVPAAQPGDLLWTCGSWLEGAASTEGGRLGSFAALDALIAELVREWPSLRTVTVAGFSAGGQMVQHSIGFAAAPPAGVSLRYVVADPGTWLYLDAFRPRPAELAGCPAVNRWKSGTEALPAHFTHDAAQARTQYAAAEIHYVEGELDSSDAKGTSYRVLDKSCPADAQGPFRLQRGLAYAEYDRRLLAPAHQRQVTVVPGCAHDVACVFPAPQARAALFGNGR